MSLKNDYLTGPSGLEQQTALAFEAGEAFVGTGAAAVESLYLGDRNGSNLGAGSSNPGTYFDIDGASAGYRVWMLVSGEVAPANAGRTLVQVTLLSGDTSAQAATKIAAALNALPQMDFTATTIGGAISMTLNAPKLVNPIVLGASGWGTAVAAEVQPGVNPTGNYLTISNALKAAAACGRTQFVLNIQVSYNPTALRANNGNNLILKSYTAGILQAFAAEEIYDYEVRPVLNVSDRAITSMDLNFNFSYNQKNHGDASHRIPAFQGSCNTCG